MRPVLVLIAAYLLGSIPFGYLIVRAKEGADVRESGSGGGKSEVVSPAGHTVTPPIQGRFRSYSDRATKTKGHAVVQAYILIQTEVGKAAAVAAAVASLPGVASAEDVTGPYDVIVRAEAVDVDQLGQLVVARVQNVDGITRTLTCPVVHLS